MEKLAEMVKNGEMAVEAVELFCYSNSCLRS